MIDVSRQTEFRDRAIDSPFRVPIDIENAVFADGVEPVEIGDGLIHRVRINRLRGPNAQIVLDLVADSEYRAFALRAYEQKPERIVVDIFREETKPEDVDIVGSPDDGVDVIVIDPGHGGEDPGAVGRNDLYEKDVVFDYAQELTKELERRGKRIRVKLTRTGDYYVGLRKRYRYAGN